jgi:mediator of RNA polymerase II transcription subunit 6
MDGEAAAQGKVGIPLRKDQLLQVFRHPEYLSAIGGQLTPNNVLDYFRYSAYYEQNCNNAILQMQNTADLSYMLTWDPSRLEQELKRFIGLEYVVVHAKPPELFVIHQRWRSSPSQTTVLECYYVLNGNIHMAADIYSILGSKLVSVDEGQRELALMSSLLLFSSPLYQL